MLMQVPCFQQKPGALRRKHYSMVHVVTLQISFSDTPSPFKVDTETVTVSAASVEAVLVNADNDVRFRMDIAGVRDETFRVRVREAFPKVPRFEVPHVLDGDPEQAQVEVVDRYVVRCSF